MQVHAIIHGRVQGVFFRSWTQQKASALGLVGWVRNLPDGSVELLAQGGKDPLEELLRLCRIGPPAAQVAELQSRWSDEDSEFPEFLIER